MLEKFKNLKIVKQLNEAISPRLRWLNYAQTTKNKNTTEYISKVTGIDDLKSNSDERRLEAMVREQLKEEFPNIEKMKSYELLVDAVMHNLRKKQLQAMDEHDLK